MRLDEREIRWDGYEKFDGTVISFWVLLRYLILLSYPSLYFLASSKPLD